MNDIDWAVAQRKAKPTMNKPVWKNEPEWADRLMKSVDGEYFWCDVEKYLLAGGKFFARKFGEENSFTIGEFELVEMRSDPWKEGEERMKAIGPNGNDGEHYEETYDLALELIRDKSLPVIEIDNNNKYSRKIKAVNVAGQCIRVYVDVYDVLQAFNVTNSATAHAIKKLLAAGQRGAKGSVQDIEEARDSITRAVQLEENK
jgi:hypothetical protein